MFDADEVDAAVGAGGGGVFDADGAVVTEPDWAISVGDGIEGGDVAVHAVPCRDESGEAFGGDADAGFDVAVGVLGGGGAEFPYST